MIPRSAPPASTERPFLTDLVSDGDTNTRIQAIMLRRCSCRTRPLSKVGPMKLASRRWTNATRREQPRNNDDNTCGQQCSLNFLVVTFFMPGRTSRCRVGYIDDRPLVLLDFKRERLVRSRKQRRLVPCADWRVVTSAPASAVLSTDSGDSRSS